MSSAPLKTFLLPDEKPSLADTVFVAPGATVIGAVTLGDESSVWYGAVLRGDINRVIVGAQSNVQDLSVLHVSDDFAAVVGERVTIGHRAIVHACTIGDEVLIGMGAIVLDGAVIAPDSIVGAGSLVTGGQRFPPRSMILGSPAKAVRTLRDEEVASILRASQNYIEYTTEHRSGA